MSTVEEILADVPNEGDKDLFKDLEKETPTESPTEIKPESVKPLEGDNTPDNPKYADFRQHPRWIQREKELEELKTREEENARVIAELSAFKEETSRRLGSDTSIPDWFRELYGDNETAWKKYNEHEQAKEAAIEERLIARQEQARKEEQTNVAKWNKWVDEQVTMLQSEGLKFDRNELIKTMLDYRPTDENNNFDFHKGYKIYEALKGKPDTEHSQARKQLADTTTKVSGEPRKKDYMTAADLRHRSWGNL